MSRPRHRSFCKFRLLRNRRITRRHWIRPDMSPWRRESRARPPDWGPRRLPDQLLSLTRAVDRQLFLYSIRGQRRRKAVKDPHGRQLSQRSKFRPFFNRRPLGNERTGYDHGRFKLRYTFQRESQTTTSVLIHFDARLRVVAGDVLALRYTYLETGNNSGA